MKTSVKLALIVGGYVAAFLIAWAVVAIYDAGMVGPDIQGSDGMIAFGESLLFLAVFAVAAVPPTGGALLLLRGYRLFWRGLSILALVFAATALAAIVTYLGSRHAASGSALHAWSALAVLRVLVAPLFALLSALAALVAPIRSDRIALLIAATIEAAVFACTALAWFLQLRG